MRRQSRGRLAETRKSTISDDCAGHDNAAWNDGSVDLGKAGEHAHISVSGGDKETWPIHIAPDHIIKFAEPAV